MPERTLREILEETKGWGDWSEGKRAQYIHGLSEAEMAHLETVVWEAAEMLRAFGVSLLQVVQPIIEATSVFLEQFRPSDRR